MSGGYDTFSAVQHSRMPEASRSAAPPSVCFDGFELCSEQGALFHRGRRLKLQPQPLRVLAYLIARAPAVVTREELGSHIWGAGVHVDLDQSLSYCIRQVRKALGDSAVLPRYIETLPKQGYRFSGPVPACPGDAGEARQAIREDVEVVMPAPPPSLGVTSKLKPPAVLPEAARRTAWKLVLTALLVMAALGAAWVRYGLPSTTAARPIATIAEGRTALPGPDTQDPGTILMPSDLFRRVWLRR